MLTVLEEAQWNEDGEPTKFVYYLTQPDLAIGECTSFTNTAWILETEQSAEAVFNLVRMCAHDRLDAAFLEK